VACAAALHFNRVEAGIAADIEYCFAGKIVRQCMGKALELHIGIIAEEVIGSGFDTVQIYIVEPLPELLYLPRNLVFGHGIKLAKIEPRGGW
jgi:hypothetical protein